MLKNNSVKTTFYSPVNNLTGESKKTMEGIRGDERLSYFPLRLLTLNISRKQVQ